MDIQALHTALMRPETYPEEGPVQFVETHVSRLYLTPQHVYKIKKPVDFGFLNFTTLDRRRFYCGEEVRLNRRFAPDTYLGVVDIRRKGDRISFGGEGEAVEYAVLMRRLPEERMLDRLLAAGDGELPAAMERIGRRVAELHRESEICRNDGGQSNLEIVRFNWRENFAQTAPFAGRTLERGALDLVSSYVGDFLAAQEPLLKRREAEGWVRDGHGDLHAEHICLTEPVRIYDCIEFNRRFRVGDVAADLAFLLMDLEFRGRRDLAAALLSAYVEALAGDGDLALLVPFYKIYRAWVRGKVESFLSADPAAAPEARSDAAGRARRYFTLAAAYLCPPVAVLTCGLMGTGKSTVARALAAVLGADLLRSDEVRKEIAGDLAPSGAGAPFGSGIYAADFTRRTYELLLERARLSLRAGRSVVVDASFAQSQERERFLREARNQGMPAVVISTQCDRETALGRLDLRQALGGDPSDGRRELYDRQAELFEEPGPDAIRIDTVQGVDYNVHSAVLEIIRKIGTRR